MRITLILLLLATSAFADESQAPDPKILRAASNETAAKLRTTPAAWTVTMPISASTSLSADVIQNPGARRTIFRVDGSEGTHFEYARMIETDSAWYVTREGVRWKVRPWEAILPTNIYLLRTFADLQFAADVADLGQFKSNDGNIVRYALPAPPAARNALAQYEEAVKAKLQGDHPDPKVVAQLAKMRKTVSEGSPLAFDKRTGICTELTLGSRSMVLSDFRWLEALPPGVFDQDQQKWVDDTADPTASADDLAHTATFTHDPSWRPGRAEGEPPGVLVNLVTGQTRRLPFRGIGCIAHCFTNDRSAVIVTGEDVLRGGMPLHQIDLKTGANRPLGGAAYGAGIVMMASASPDGKRCAATYVNPAGRVTDMQVLVFDLTTGEATPVGKPFEGGMPIWLPDSTGFIVIRRADDNDPNRSSLVCKLDLQGNFTPLFRGRSHEVIPGRKSIVFQDAEKQWRICDLDGKNAVVIGNGFPRYDSASPSPDGKRLLMTAETPDQLSRPIIVDLDTGKSTSVPVAPGLWRNPAWR